MWIVVSMFHYISGDNLSNFIVKVCRCEWVYAHVHVSECECEWVWVQVHVCACMCAYACMHVRAYVCAHMCACVYMHVCRCVCMCVLYVHVCNANVCACACVRVKGYSNNYHSDYITTDVASWGRCSFFWAAVPNFSINVFTRVFCTSQNVLTDGSILANSSITNIADINDALVPP